MPVTGWRSPTTCIDADRDGRNSWSDPEQAAASDDNRAYCSVTGPDYTDWLQCTNFGFSAEVPSGAIITGIEVEIERRESDASYDVKDSAIYLRKTAGQVGDNKADTETEWPVPEAYKAYGGDSDLWGATWSRDDIISADFGIDISAYIGCIEMVGIAFIDHVRIRVYYTLSKGYHMIL